jgi:hypothetical protein
VKKGKDTVKTMTHVGDESRTAKAAAWRAYFNRATSPAARQM